MGQENFNQVINNLSEYSRAAVRGISISQKIQILNNKNEVVDVARKIVKVKRPGKFEESH